MPGTVPLPCQKVGLIAEDPVHSMIFPEMTALDNLCFLADCRTPHLWRDRALQRSIQREYEVYLGDAIYENDVLALSHRARFDLVYYRMCGTFLPPGARTRQYWVKSKWLCSVSYK